MKGKAPYSGAILIADFLTFHFLVNGTRHRLAFLASSFSKKTCIVLRQLSLPMPTEIRKVISVWCQAWCQDSSMVRFLRIDPMVSGSSPTSAKLSLRVRGVVSVVTSRGRTRTLLDKQKLLSVQISTFDIFEKKW